MTYSLFAHHVYDDTSIWLAFEYINIFMYIGLYDSNLRFTLQAGNSIPAIRHGYNNMYNGFINI